MGQKATIPPRSDSQDDDTFNSQYGMQQSDSLRNPLYLARFEQYQSNLQISKEQNNTSPQKDPDENIGNQFIHQQKLTLQKSVSMEMREEQIKQDGLQKVRDQMIRDDLCNFDQNNGVLRICLSKQDKKIQNIFNGLPLMQIGNHLNQLCIVQNASQKQIIDLQCEFSSKIGAQANQLDNLLSELLKKTSPNLRCLTIIINQDQNIDLLNKPGFEFIQCLKLCSQLVSLSISLILRESQLQIMTTFNMQICQIIASFQNLRKLDLEIYTCKNLNWRDLHASLKAIGGVTDLSLRIHQMDKSVEGLSKVFSSCKKVLTVLKLEIGQCKGGAQQQAQTQQAQAISACSQQQSLAKYLAKLQNLSILNLSVADFSFMLDHENGLLQLSHAVQQMQNLVSFRLHTEDSALMVGEFMREVFLLIVLPQLPFLMSCVVDYQPAFKYGMVQYGDIQKKSKEIATTIKMANPQIKQILNVRHSAFYTIRSAMKALQKCKFHRCSMLTQDMMSYIDFNRMENKKLSRHMVTIENFKRQNLYRLKLSCHQHPLSMFEKKLQVCKFKDNPLTPCLEQQPFDIQSNNNWNQKVFKCLDCIPAGIIESQTYCEKCSFNYTTEVLSNQSQLQMIYSSEHPHPLNRIYAFDQQNFKKHQNKNDIQSQNQNMVLKCSLCKKLAQIDWEKMFMCFNQECYNTNTDSLNRFQICEKCFDQTQNFCPLTNTFDSSLIILSSLTCHPLKLTIVHPQLEHKNNVNWYCDAVETTKGCLRHHVKEYDAPQPFAFQCTLKCNVAFCDLCTWNNRIVVVSEYTQKNDFQKLIKQKCSSQTLFRIASVNDTLALSYMGKIDCLGCGKMFLKFDLATLLKSYIGFKKTTHDQTILSQDISDEVMRQNIEFVCTHCIKPALSQKNEV